MVEVSNDNTATIVDSDAFSVWLAKLVALSEIHFSFTSNTAAPAGTRQPV